MGKITMQDIADALNISRVSVWKVFNNQSGISDMLRERVMHKASELGYIKPTSAPPAARNSGALTISVVVSRPNSSAFWTDIIHRIAQELARFQVNLLYTYIPAAAPEGYSLPEVLKNGTVQGAIVLNVYEDKILELLNELSLSLVFLDTTPGFSPFRLKGDLVLLEGVATVGAIVDHLVGMGLRDIGFVGDIRYAMTNKHRYQGYREAMDRHGLVVDSTHLMANPIDIFDYYQVINDYLESLDTFPEAFVCVSDFVANFIYQYFLEHPGRLRAPLMITGYDGASEYPNVKHRITTAFVDTYQLGRRLANQLLYRIENSEAQREVLFIYPTLRFVDKPLLPQSVPLREKAL